MGIDDHLAPCRLAKYLGQPYNRHQARTDDVGQDLPGSYARQLIDIAHDQQGRRIWERLEQCAHQRHVHHAGLVQDQ